jgi:hypothetical protein
MDEDPFDVAKLRLTPEMLAENSAKLVQLKATRQRQKAKAGHFVMLPYEKMLEVCGWRDASAAVLVELAYRAFRAHGTEFALPNKALEAVGVSPDAKVRALHRLEAVGLVAVDWRTNGQTPIVTIRGGLIPPHLRGR